MSWRPAENSLSAFAHGSPFSLFWPLAILFAVGAFLAPGPAQTTAGAVLLGCGVLLGLLVGGRLGMLYLLAAFVGFEIGFRNAGEYAAAALPIDLARQLVRVLAVPVLVHACIPSSTRSSKPVTPRLLYLPLLLTVPLTVFATVRAAAQPPAPPLPAIDAARLVFGLYYVVLLMIVVAARWHEAPVVKSERERAAEAEVSGRFAVAGRMHARAGRVALGAEAAQRGGDIALAARLYRESGDPLKAGDMYYRAGQLEEAAQQYQQAGAHAAVARVYERLGRPQEAAGAWERAGNLAAAVRALEGGGLQPPAELLYRAGRAKDAVAAWQAAGAHVRAAEILEQELGDLVGAAGAYLQARQPRRAGELLERLGRHEEAIDAYGFAPDGWFDVLRLTVETGQLERAEAMLASAPPGAVESLQSERELLTLARLHERAGRTKAAIGLLQKAKRLESGSGAMHLTLGRLLQGDGLAEIAEQELRTASEMPLDPEQQLEATYLLACVLESRGREDEACAIFAELAQKDLLYRDVEERYRRLRSLQT